MAAVELKQNLWWVGALDPNLRVFDIVMTTPFGTTYNSFLLKGQKANVLFETVKEQFHDEFEKRLASVLKPGEKIDYFVLNHTEPDHSGSLARLIDRFPDATVVATRAAHDNLEFIAHRKFNKVVVEEGTMPIDIGGYTLRFVVSPFLHWPDTMFTYVEQLGVVVTCDFLGSHYSFEGVVDTGMTPKQNEDYLVAAKGYYDPIFGPFKSYVLAGLEHLSKLKFDTVLCSHGPVLRAGVKRIMDLYNKWSQQEPLQERVVVAYVSAYRYTKVLAEAIATAIEATGLPVATYDLVEKPVKDALADIERSKGFVLGTPTILGDALPPLWQILTSLNTIIHKDHVAGVFGSYGWSGEGTRNLSQRLDQLRFRQPLEPLAVRFKPADSDMAKCREWAEQFARAVKGETLENEREAPALTPIGNSSKKLSSQALRSLPDNDGRLRRWRCIVCGEVVISVLRPQVCNACGAGPEAFVCLGFVNDPTASPSMRSSFSGRVVIVGGGCAAVSAAKAAREASASAQVTLVCEEPEPPYYRPALTRALADAGVRKAPTFRLVPDGWWTESRIELLLGATATSVDTAAHCVRVALPGAGGVREVAYDQLILATGGKNFVPCPVEQTTAHGVFNLRTVADSDKIAAEVAARKAAGKTTTAVVVGGGLAALESAEALLSLGVRVHIVELMPRLLPRQLTEDGSRLYTNALSATGVVLHLGTCVREIQRGEGGAVSAVALTNGQTVTADIVAFGVGTVPEIALARAAGITCNRGILVDECMRTNVAGVFAAGDCTEFAGKNIPNWTEATAQGRAAGLQAVGAPKVDGAVFHRIASPYYIDAFCPIFSIGSVPTDAHVAPARRVVFGTSNEFAELYFSEAQGGPVLIGAQIVGSRAKKLQTPIAIAINNGASLAQAVDIVAPEFY